MNRKFTYEITKEECVGDSLGKYNFNFLSLDSVVCNLSSLFFTNTNGNNPIWSSMVDLSSNFKSYNQNLYQMVDPFKYVRAYLGTNTLSSYWNRQYITVEYPFNRLNTQGIQPNWEIDTYNITQIPKVSALCLKHIEYVLPASSCNLYAVCDVAFPFYANNGEILKTYGYYDASGNFVGTGDSIPLFENMPRQISGTSETRSMYVEFKKADSNFSTTHVVRFFNQNINDKKQWTYQGTLSAACAADIITATSQIYDVTGASSAIAQTSNFVKITNPCTPIQFNQWYSMKDFAYAEAYAKGKSLSDSYILTAGAKVGTINLRIKLADGTIYQYSYKATGNLYANTAGFGIDTYLSWNSSQILAYDGNPNPKTLRITWPNPFRSMQGVYFMFTKDSEVFYYNACAAGYSYQ